MILEATQKRWAAFHAAKEGGRFEAQKRRIDEPIAELRAIVTGRPTAIDVKQIAASRKKFSA